MCVCVRRQHMHMYMWRCAVCSSCLRNIIPVCGVEYFLMRTERATVPPISLIREAVQSIEY